MRYLMILGLFMSCFTLAFAQENVDKTEVPSAFDPNSLAGDPLYLRSVRGIAKIISKDEFEKINTEDVDYIKMITDPSSIYIYGDKGKNGVVLVVMKDHSLAGKYSSRKRRQK